MLFHREFSCVQMYVNSNSSVIFEVSQIEKSEVNNYISDIIYDSTSNIMKIAYTGFHALPDEQWKCDIILELRDCIYGFSNCGLSYDEAKYCLCHVASD